MKHFIKIGIIVFEILLLLSCFTAGISTINSYPQRGFERFEIRKAFDIFWNSYPLSRLNEKDKIFLCGYDDPSFNCSKGNLDCIMNDPKAFYPLIFKPTSNSVNYVYYFVKSRDSNIIYTIGLTDYGYSLINCIDIKERKVISSGYSNIPRKVVKQYKKQFEGEIKTKLDSILTTTFKKETPW